MAKPKNCELRQLNSLLEEVRGKLIRSYQELRLKDEPVTAELVKKIFLRVDKPVDQKTLLWLVNQHNIIMKVVLSNGTLKNYFTTQRYLKGFMEQPKYNGAVVEGSTESGVAACMNMGREVCRADGMGLIWKRR